MTAHAKLGPSGSSRWIACPGSPALCAGIPDTSSAAAELGTAAHELGEHCLTDELGEGLIATDRLGWVFNGHVVDAEMSEAVQEYLDVVHGLIVDPGEGVLHVIDYKHGAGIFVDVDMNPQLLIYALGALRLIRSEAAYYPGRVGAQLLVEKRVEITDDVWGTADAIVIGPGSTHTVCYHVVQPRHRLGGHHVAAISVGDLLNWRTNVLLPAVAYTKKPDAELNPGEHCRFCAAKPSCSALRSKALNAARYVFDGDPEDLTLRAKPIVVEAMPPVELAKALDAFPAIEQWMKAVRDYAYTQAREKGRKIPGRKLVDIIGHRKFTDLDLAEIMCIVHGVDPFEPRKLRSPAALEKLLPKGHKGVLNSLIVKPVTGTALVADSDKRPAKNAAAVFGEITD